VAVAVAFSHVVRADDAPTLTICQLPLQDEPAPGCHAIDSVRTRWGKVTLFSAYDTRSTKLTPPVIQRGEYLAVYSLVFAGRDEPETFEEGGPPTGHPYEMCGSQSNWSERIVSSMPRLFVDKSGSVTLIVRTTTRVQRWVDVDLSTERV